MKSPCISVCSYLPWVHIILHVFWRQQDIYKVNIACLTSIGKVLIKANTSTAQVHIVKYSISRSHDDIELSIKGRTEIRRYLSDVLSGSVHDVWRNVVLSNTDIKLVLSTEYLNFWVWINRLSVGHVWLMLYNKYFID